MTGTYLIGDQMIGISSLYSTVHDYCRDYRAEGAPVFFVETTPEDLVFERERSEQIGEVLPVQSEEIRNKELELLAVYRRIAEQMPFRDTFLFHGSAIAVDGAAYLFTARSGTGKSTHTRLWREMLGDRAVMVNDDKPLIRLTEDGAVVYGTPWNGKHRLGTNISVPLKAVCILERAKQNTIRAITREEAFPMLIQQSYRPLDPAALAKTLSLVDRLSRTVSLYRLGCNMDPNAAELSYNIMKEATRQ